MSHTRTSLDERGIEHAAWPAAWLRRTLGEIIWQIRGLLDVSGCAFQAVDGTHDDGAPTAAWYGSDEARHAIARLVAGRSAGPAQSQQGGVDAISPLVVHSCPVRTAAGRTLGLLVICFARGARSLREDDAGVVTVLADLAALALERAELLDREEARVSKAVLLNEAAHEVTRSLETEDVYRAIIDQAALLTGATKIVLARLEPATRDLTVVAAEGVSEMLATARFPIGEGMIGQVARTGKPYVSRSTEADRWLQWAVEADRVASFIHAPISLGPRLFGVLTVADERSDQFGEAQLALLMALARIAAGAIANALDFERERRIAHALTTGFVAGPAPELPGIELGLVYRPAGRELCGGDVFGVWPRASGDVMFLVGDVAGKGLEVAALSAMVRFFVEARAWDHLRPSDVLRQAGELLSARLPDGRFVSAFLGVLHSGGLRYCNAGHAPAMVVRADGTLEGLPATGIPLGIVDDAQYDEVEVPCGPGDLLFAATDGLAEARRGDAYFGEERLRDLLTAQGPSLAPQPLVELLAGELEAWAPAIDDDVLILAARPREVERPTPRPRPRRRPRAA